MISASYNKLSGLTLGELQAMYIKANDLMLRADEYNHRANTAPFPSAANMMKENQADCLKDFHRLTGFYSWDEFKLAYDSARRNRSYAQKM